MSNAAESSERLTSVAASAPADGARSSTSMCVERVASRRSTSDAETGDAGAAQLADQRQQRTQQDGSALGVDRGCVARHQDCTVRRTSVAGDRSAATSWSPDADSFDPTRPPPAGWPVSGVVFDGRTQAAASRRCARMCDRAGIDAVWVADRWPARPAAAVMRGRSQPTSLGTAPATATAGAIVGPAGRPSGARRSTARPRGRLHDGGDDGADRTRRSAMQYRGRASRAGCPSSSDAERELGPLLAVADDIVLPAWRPLGPGDGGRRGAGGRSRRVRPRPGDARGRRARPGVDRPDGRRGCRPGRRWIPTFAASVTRREIGIFGTLEECQDRVIALAHAGITDLRCVVPGDARRPRRHRPADGDDDRDDRRPRARLAALAGAAAAGRAGAGDRPDRRPRPLRVSGGSATALIRRAVSRTSGRNSERRVAGSTRPAWAHTDSAAADPPVARR